VVEGSRSAAGGGAKKAGGRLTRREGTAPTPRPIGSIGRNLTLVSGFAPGANACLFSVLGPVDAHPMRTKSDEARLQEVREKIQDLYSARGDGFNLPARYEALVTLEAILLDQLEQQRVGV
jgi:hypothetical protein